MKRPKRLLLNLLTDLLCSFSIIFLQFAFFFFHNQEFFAARPTASAWQLFLAFSTVALLIFLFPEPVFLALDSMPGLLSVAVSSVYLAACLVALSDFHLTGKDATIFPLSLALHWQIASVLLWSAAQLFRRISCRGQHPFAAYMDSLLHTALRIIRYIVIPFSIGLVVNVVRLADKYSSQDLPAVVMILRMGFRIPWFTWFKAVSAAVLLLFLLLALLKLWWIDCRRPANVITVRARSWQYPLRLVLPSLADSVNKSISRSLHLMPYSPVVYAHARKLQDVVLVVFWNSREDWDLPRRQRRDLMALLRGAEQRGCQIIVRDSYPGGRDYTARGELGAFLSRYPYYRQSGLDNVDLLLRDEVVTPAREANRLMRQRINSCMECARSTGDPVLASLAPGMSGASTELTRYFYILIKMCEYLIHTEALSILCGSSAPPLRPDRLEKPAMGDFADCLPAGEALSAEQYAAVIDSLRFLNTAVTRGGQNRLRQVSYRELCQILCRVRRRFIGHGTMVYAVSLAMVSHLAQVTLVMLQRRQTLGLTLTPEMSFELKGRRVPAAVRQKKRLLYYSAADGGGSFRYLDYSSGDTLSCDPERSVYDSRLRLNTFEEWKEELA